MQLADLKANDSAGDSAGKPAELVLLHPQLAGANVNAAPVTALNVNMNYDQASISRAASEQPQGSYPPPSASVPPRVNPDGTTELERDSSFARRANLVVPETFQSRQPRLRDRERKINQSQDHRAKFDEKKFLGFATDSESDWAAATV